MVLKNQHLLSLFHHLTGETEIEQVTLLYVRGKRILHGQLDVVDHGVFYGKFKGRTTDQKNEKH